MNRLSGAWRRLSDTAYAAYAQFTFWLLAPAVWLLVALLPPVRWRWAVMRGGARLLFRLSCAPLRVVGLEQLPRDRACIMVANHSSYLDGVALVAALPLEFSFVAKAELERQLIPRIFLGRIETRYVDRNDKRRHPADARELLQTACAGRSLLFFPEGTLTRIPGLLPFHTGAFVTAAEAGLPVVPISILGTRSILCDQSRFAHRAAVRVVIGKPLAPTGSDWAAAVALRDAAREAMLDHLDEPDLAGKASLPAV